VIFPRSRIVRTLEGIPLATDEEQRLFVRYLAKQVKELYRDSLVLRAVSQYLRDEGVEGLDQIIEDARRSPELQENAIRFDRAVDEYLPPSDEANQDQALLKLIQRLGLDSGTIH